VLDIAFVKDNASVCCVGCPWRDFFLLGEGPRSRCYGRTTALRLFVQPYDEDEDEDEQFFLPSFKNNGAPVE
jgi:hypothetical protein